ncbi:MAG TPA: S4 domain-containing protein [Arenicellales bacterium]|jgi:ribosome-associated heat shock protein Hsp15|nr:S4 domain-containing protein [Arenicellales bacterium]HJP11579.1 S4 domain-containing protein [Arenicellales bacterium]|tara:strand:- start:2114 stop:2527 length:414 start_codon:yes stop_codon:yes gene_type:complete
MAVERMLMEKNDGVRLDRWLWSARFFKTRQNAADAVRSGRVLINEQRTKPAKTIRTGDKLQIRKAAFRYLIEVTVLTEKRVGPAIAASLYRESDESLQARRTLQEQMKAQRSSTRIQKGRPSKRDRRLIERLHGRGH